ncbi:MAG: YidC/Oxa1 family membrane protein insertase [Chloroflexota bacterium]
MSEDALPVDLRTTLRRIAPFVLLAIVVLLVVAACVPGATSPGASGVPTPTQTALAPAKPGAAPISLLAWLFTPVFQLLFITLVAINQVVGDMGIAIVILTLIIRVILVPVFRRQIVGQRRMQLIQPEIKALQARYKGDKAKVQQATMELYKERGVNPLAGCVPTLITFLLLIPMYSVISAGLTNFDPNAMLNVFGHQLILLDCPSAPVYVNGVVEPCLDTTVWWLGNMNIAYPSILFSVFGFGISVLAVISALLQVVQTRMIMPPATPGDSQGRLQQQMFLFVPLISVLYGAILPAGLFIYWVVTTIFSIAQQYLIVGWGSLFPIFGWNPGFAQGHKPRFPVTFAAPAPKNPADPGGSAGTMGSRSESERAASAQSTVRQRGRQGRRGRRR